MKKLPVHKIIANRHYPTSELAVLLNRHPKTMQRLLKKIGAKQAGIHRRKRMFLGKDLKPLLKKKVYRKKFKLKNHEFMCFHCEEPATAKEGSVTIVIGKKIGTGGVRQVTIRALCSHCSEKVVKISSSQKIACFSGMDTQYQRL